MTYFSKDPKTYDEQLQILRNRGLEVRDHDFAIHCLLHLNYYRLSAYRLPFLSPKNPSQPDEPERFRAGTAFEDIWKLYDFDQTLRRLILDASKRVEVSVRSRWAYVLAHSYHAFAYEEAVLFINPDRHREMLQDLDKELQRSKEDFVTHFRQNHGLPRPPIWAACEVCSFGLTSRFVNNLLHRADRQEIARPYGIDESVLRSFLHHLTVVRNHSAHHGRVWNRRFGNKQFKLPNHPAALKVNFSSDAVSELRIYNTLTMLLHLLSVIDPACPLPAFLYQTLNQADVVFHGHMGFPEDWRGRPLWAAAGSE